MDFTYRYTEEQERFRQEVRAWLQENIPDGMTEPVDPDDLTDEQYAFARELDKKLAAKGWLFPSMSKEYGGGGMSVENDAIIQEEFERKGMVSPVSGIPGALMVWATEEQKQEFLRPILMGEKTALTLLTEPRGGADLASLETQAVRDGDDWLITGVKCFITHRREPDMMFGPAVTDPDAPRHRNLGYFVIPVPAPGLVLQNMKLVNGKDQHFIFMDNVRVPGQNLLGGDHQGWQVTQTALGGRGLGAPFLSDPVFDWGGPKFPWENLVSYVQDTQRQGESLGKDPIMEQLTLDCYLDTHIHTMLSKRNAWMYQSRMELSYQGPEADVHKRNFCLRNPTRIRDIMGMYSFLNGRDPRAPFGGLADVSARNSFMSQHGAGSLNISKVTHGPAPGHQPHPGASASHRASSSQL